MTANAPSNPDQPRPHARPIEWAIKETEARAIALKWAARLGGGFHPDTPAEEYVDTKTSKPSLSLTEQSAYNRDMDTLMAAMDYGVDPYDLAATALDANADRRVLRPMFKSEIDVWQGVDELPSGRERMIAYGLIVEVDGHDVDSMLILGTGDDGTVMLQLFTNDDHPSGAEVLATWQSAEDEDVDMAEERLVLMTRMLLSTRHVWTRSTLRALGADLA